MIIIRFIDLYTTFTNDKGEEYEKLSVRNFTLPTIIDESRIVGINPFFSKKGKLFKNVSMIRYDNEIIKVIGNYKELEKRRKPGCKIKGYNNGNR